MAREFRPQIMGKTRIRVSFGPIALQHHRKPSTARFSRRPLLALSPGLQLDNQIVDVSVSKVLD